MNCEKKQTSSKVLESGFEPSMKTLQRIFKSLEENGSDCKSSLACYTNLNYCRLAKHIVWLEKKGLVESVISDQKINVVLTHKGRIFGTILQV